VRKTGQIVDRLTAVVAIELMAAAQAVDLRGTVRLGRGTRVAYDAVRQVVEPLDEDRALSAEVERLHVLIASGKLLTAVRWALQA